MKEIRIEVKYLNGKVKHESVLLSNAPVSGHTKLLCYPENKWVIPNVALPLNSLPNDSNSFFNDGDIVFEVPEAARVIFVQNATVGLLPFNANSVKTAGELKAVIRKSGMQNFELKLTRLGSYNGIEDDFQLQSLKENSLLNLEAKAKIIEIEDCKLDTTIGSIIENIKAARSNKNLSTSYPLEEFSPKVSISGALIGAMIGAGDAYISSGQGK